MLARLQQLITFAALMLALLVLVWFLHQGRFEIALLGAVLVLGGHSLILALEFVFVRWAHGADPTPKASVLQLTRAWWGEVCAAPVVFCWRQPFCSQRWPDLLPDLMRGLQHEGAPSTDSSSKVNARVAAQRRGVLLVHGFVCNRGLWNPWLQQLHAQGTPVIAVNLEPVFGSIDNYLQTIDTAVADLHRTTGLAPVAVAHSMGGLALRRWYAEQADAKRLHHVITIGSPHHGTWLARFAVTRNARQMQQQSLWLQTLEAREKHSRAQRFTCFYGHCDNIVFPPATATLAGADNRHLPGIAHVHMVDAPEPWLELMRRLA